MVRELCVLPFGCQRLLFSASNTTERTPSRSKEQRQIQPDRSGADNDHRCNISIHFKSRRSPTDALAGKGHLGWPHFHPIDPFTNVGHESAGFSD